MEIVFNAFIIAFLVYFLKACTWPGMIFEKPGKWIEDRLGEYWSKPVIGCPICMTPWWGSLIYAVCHFAGIRGFEDWRFVTVVVTLFAAAGINVIVLMQNKEYDVAKKEDKLLKKEMEEEGIK